MRFRTVVVLAALIGLLALPAGASHTTRGSREARVGDKIFIVQTTTTSKLVDWVAAPPGILTFDIDRGALVATCTRPGIATVTYKFTLNDEVHTHIETITCLSVKQDD
jgi:hypothetical protein